MKKYKRGIFIGKFYPLHNGHLLALTALSKVCDQAYLVFYNSRQGEEKIAKLLGYEYGIDLRVSDAKEVLREYKNISVVKIDVPKDMVFPDDAMKIQAVVEEGIGGKADIQIFGAEEKDMYAPYAYADKYTLAPVYEVESKEGETVSLHATLIRNDYEFYKKYVPLTIRKSLDDISSKHFSTL